MVFKGSVVNMRSIDVDNNNKKNVFIMAHVDSDILLGIV